MVTSVLLLIMYPFSPTGGRSLLGISGVCSSLYWCNSGPGYMWEAPLKWGGLLVMLTWVVLILMNLSAPPSMTLLSAVSSLIACLIVFFMTDKAILFYISFETTLLPMALVILGWGYQPERLGAVLYMLFYTMAGAIPFLGLILFKGGFMFTASSASVVDSSISTEVVSLIYLMPFLVKTPMFLLHLWLPKAHVEAPVYGSMLLAGVLLKMGGWGIFRLSPAISLGTSAFVGALSLVGGALAIFVTLTQVDIKSLIAYSSVVHMSMATTCLLLPCPSGLSPVWMMLMGHGVCSAGLFYGATSLYYRAGTRSLLLTQGVMKLMPGVMLTWVVLILMNLSAPPSMTLMSEVLMISSVLSSSQALMFWVSMMIVGALIYTLSLFYNYTFGGASQPYPQSPESLKELFVLSHHAQWWVISPITLWLFE